MKRTVIKISITLLTLFSANARIEAQSLDNLQDKQAIKMSGALNMTGIGYGINGIEARRDPFNWFMTGNLNLSLYGWNIPFSFSYSNQNRAFRQPFNQYGIAPEYKWIKVYAGYNALNYSRYTLAGHVFLGGAVELTPGNWRVSAMYGRLNKAIEEDSIDGQFILPAYKRMGFGAKVGYDDNGNSVDLILFRGWDELNSISAVSEDSEILPNENLVISLVGKKAITQRININAEYATSAFTRDIRTEKTNTSANTIFSNVGALYTTRESSNFYQAFNTAVNYLGDFYAIQLGYERVDPQYQTLGAYFFNNDLENITVGGNVQLFQSALNLSGNVGFQKNNLDETEVSSTTRNVYAINANFIPSEKWNLNGSYSNFTTFTNVRPRFDPFFQNDLDSLNFYQINQSMAATAAYTFGSKDRQQSLFINSSLQVANEESDAAMQETLDNNTLFTGNSLSYRYSLRPINLSVSAALNVNLNQIAGNETWATGPNLSVSKSFLKKQLRTSLSSTYNNVNTNGLLTSRILNVRISSNYIIKKKHVFGLNTNLLRNFGIDSDRQDIQNQRSFTELTMTMNYGYSF